MDYPLSIPVLDSLRDELVWREHIARARASAASPEGQAYGERLAARAAKTLAEHVEADRLASAAALQQLAADEAQKGRQAARAARGRRWPPVRPYGERSARRLLEVALERERLVTELTEQGRLDLAAKIRRPAPSRPPSGRWTL